MFEGFDDLYQEVIMDHNKKPRNFRVMKDADRTVEGQNPLCGDEIVLYLKMDGDRIADIAFQGHGCAISKSSASVMTETVKGKTTAEAEAFFETIHHLLMRDAPNPPEEELGKLAVFSGVGEFPARVKCASLSWHALKGALEGADVPITTE